jgi:menaquinone-dependent protoporphyrinogen oxidase
MRAIVFYATREGHTRRIVEHIAIDLRAHDVDVDLQDVKTRDLSIDWSLYDWACVAASVHAGHHEPEMIAFVRAHRHKLARLSAAFLSVTLSQAGAQDPLASDERRAQSARDVQRMIDVFVEETGWQPAHVLPVAGALTYSRYNFIIRFVMKRIARKAGAPTDTSRDYEFTDWPLLDRFVRDLARTVDVRAGATLTGSRQLGRSDTVPTGIEYVSE